MQTRSKALVIACALALAALSASPVGGRPYAVAELITPPLGPFGSPFIAGDINNRQQIVGVASGASKLDLIE